MLVQIKDLKTALDKLIKVCEKAAYEDADTFMFNEQGIFAHNAVSFVQVPFMNLGTFAVKANQFLKFITALNVDEAEFTLDNEAETLTIKEGKKKVKFSVKNTVPPLTDFIKESKSVDVDPELVHALKTVAQVSFLGNPVSSREELATYIHLHDDKIESTDLSRACRITIEGMKLNSSVLIKGKDFLRVAPQGVTAIEYNDIWTYLKDADNIIYGFRTIEVGAYPNMDKQFAITTDMCTPISFDDGIIGVIDRLAAIYDYRLDGVYPSVTVNGEEAVFSYETPAVVFEERLAVGCNKDVTFRFLPERLKQSLNNYGLHLYEAGYALITQINNYQLISTVQKEKV